MSASTVLTNIRSQPQSLGAVLEYQTGPGLRAIQSAATVLATARRVVITGMGASLFAALPLEYSLCAQGIDATAIESGELFHYKRQCLEQASVVVMVSRSGESAEVVKLLDFTKVPIIGVTNTAGSTLARRATMTIDVHSLPDELIAIQTYTGTLLALNLLAGAVMDQFDTAVERVRGALAGFTEMIARCVDQPWDNFLRGGVPVYFLARGYSMASAHEGALLLHETAKAQAVAMACAAFRHGPTEMVDEGFCGVVFAPNGRTQELNRMLAADLQRFGGRVRVIGPQSFAGLDCIVTPDLPDTLAPLFEVIPLQCAALRLAEMRKVPIGEFRYTPMVTTDETSFTI